MPMQQTCPRCATVFIDLPSCPSCAVSAIPAVVPAPAPAQRTCPRCGTTYTAFPAAADCPECALRGSRPPQRPFPVLWIVIPVVGVLAILTLAVVGWMAPIFVAQSEAGKRDRAKLDIKI